MPKKFWQIGINKRFKRPSLARDYVLMVSLFVGIIILLGIFFSSYSYYAYNKERNSHVVVAANRIERSLTESFDYVSSLLEFFGKEILKFGTLDPVKIGKLLRGEFVSDAIVKGLFSWTLFDWIDSNNRLVLSTSIGEVTKVVDMSHRSYTKLAPERPWVLHFSAPSLGVPSGQWVIPAGMGIANSQGKYLGIVAMGFDLNNMTKKIERDLSNAQISYVVLTEDYQIVSASADHLLDRTSDFYKQIFTDKSYFSQKSGFFENKIRQGDIEFRYYHKMKHAPYIILTGYNYNFANNTFYRIILPIFMGFTVIGFVFLIIALRMRRTLVQPVVELADVAKELSRNKELHRSIYIPRPKTYELHMLARQLIYVQSYFRRLRISNDELAVSKDETEEANSNLKHFMRVLAHDICSPLSSAVTFAEIIKNQHFGKDSPRYIEYADNIHHVVKEVIEIVNDLLDIGKIEEGKKELKNELVQVESVMDEVVKLEQNSANHRGVKIIKEYDINQVHHLLSERKYVFRIGINLLSNAIKYSPKDDNKHIWIKVYTDEHGLYLVVKDEGYGMEDPEIAVKPFNTIRAPNFEEVTSNGLGLYSVKQMVELHQGKLIIHSKVGQGTTVICCFPVDRIAKS